MPTVPSDETVVTSVAIDHQWIVVGLSNTRINVFSARTGVLSRTLTGHKEGVWTVNLVSAGGYWVDPPRQSGQASTSRSIIETLKEDEYHIPESLRVAIGLDRRPRGSLSGLFGDATHIPRADEVPAKVSDACCASEGWGQANALVISGGCDKVLRVWDVKSGCVPL